MKPPEGRPDLMDKVVAPGVGSIDRACEVVSSARWSNVVVTAGGTGNA
jgi:hypothetical protein